MYATISIELPQITSDNFEDALASDDVLSHFFNDFLNTLCFSETLLFNQNTGVFEVASEEAELIARKIRSVLQETKSQLSMGDPSLLTITPVDNRYPVSCLDKEQGLEWIMSERLPFFLQSDCYFEYRLAKLLCRWESSFGVQRRKRGSSRRSQSAPQLGMSSEFVGQSHDAPDPLKRSHSLENISSIQGVMTKHDFPCLSDKKKSSDTKNRVTFADFPEPEKMTSFSSRPSSCPSFFYDEQDKTQEVGSSQENWNFCLTEPVVGSSEMDFFQQPITDSSGMDFFQQSITGGSEMDFLNQTITGGLEMDFLNQTITGGLEMDFLTQSSSQYCEPSEPQLEFAPASLVKQLSTMDDVCQGNIFGCFNIPGEQTNFTTKEKLCEFKGLGEEQESQLAEKKTDERTWNIDLGNVCDICHPGTCYQENKPGLDEFKEFLQGTTGEKLLSLWMDIEKLKSLQDTERKNRFLVLIRSRYLLSSSHSSLNPELLSTLGLKTSPCWTEEKLRSVQPCLTKDLLHYWAPRFWTSEAAEEDHEDQHNRLWTELWSAPSLVRQPRCDSSTVPHISDTSLTQPSIPALLEEDMAQENESMEKMSHALFVESRTGSYFTHFCVQSGNQLWVNAVYFWTDLQHYHELFYQDGLDPYRVQRVAQLLFTTYLYTYAGRSIGVDEEVRRKVQEQLKPAFEELFDKAEEHTLNILLEPWVLLVSNDQESFQKVQLYEETHEVIGEEYRELQTALEESERRLREALSLPSVGPVSLKDPHLSESWSRVPQRYQGYSLDALLRHRHEPGYFMVFLQEHDASIHMECFGDLEQYRRSREDALVKKERSVQIATKYLNRMYFFGPNSPATVQQQDEVFDLTGGPDKLKFESLTVEAAEMVQEIVKNYIEKVWLPQFLSSPEFIARHKQPEYQPSGRRPVRRRRRKTKRKVFKPDVLWMSSSREILEFRQLLLNPVTCTQFQHFVSLKEGFLENDLLFWLEVQRYKDLCHSHCSDTVIEQKITTIIDCFIDSSMPPELRIDITPEQAQNIREKRHEIGPYIFREAQLSVFSELLKFWPKFQELSKSVKKSHLLPLLQQKRVKHRARVRRERRRDEEVEQEVEDDERRRKALQEWDAQESDNSDSDMDDSEEQDGKKRDWTWQTALLSPTQPMSWSYSKYMATLKKQELQLNKNKKANKKALLETSISTVSDDSSFTSFRTVESAVSRKRSQRSPKLNNKPGNTGSRK